MFGGIPRRTFLTGVSSLGLAACSVVPGKRVLGHVSVGEGAEPVLVLHEWLGDHSNYDEVAPYLSHHHATYVFADLRGYGLSRGMAGSYTLDEAADDALALMESLGHARFHVVGHSMSGMLAQYLMALHPDRLKGAVCISPVPATGFKTDSAGIERLRKVISDDEALFAAISSRTGNRYGRPWLERKRAVARRASPEAMDGYLAMFTGSDFAARAAGSAVPVSLITGAQDIAYYSRAALEPQFRAAYPNLREVTTIADAGHYSMVETPVLLAALVDRALFGAALNRAADARTGAGGVSFTAQGGLPCTAA